MWAVYSFFFVNLTLPYQHCFAFKLQVIAFSDEEGVRFQTTFLGSGAIAGILPVSALQLSDRRFHPYISQPLSLHDTIYQYI